MRIWQGREDHTRNVHSIGNGNIIVYAQGPVLAHIFGPPYGAEITASLFPEAGLHCTSEREPGAAIWRHLLTRDGRDVATLTDFCSEGALFLRTVDAQEQFALEVEVPMQFVRENPLRQRAAGSFLVVLPPGSNVQETIVSPHEQNMLFFVTGNAELITEQDSLRLVFHPGKSVLGIAGGHSYEECFRLAEKVLSAGSDALLEVERTRWKEVMHRLQPVMDSIPPVPERARILQAIEDTAIIIKTQQCIEGGVLAGYYYHLVYVRDGYGVLRGLLRLGLTEEARMMLEFYLSTFLSYGAVHNAQGPGVFGFHIFENDASEITGYLVRMAMDYYAATQDDAFLTRLIPLMRWAINQQLGQLHRDMLPFNGDETYIAGYILPRRAVDHGSAEATLLFILSEEFLNWLDTKGEGGAWAAEARKSMRSARTQFGQNFIRDGLFYTNNPDRLDTSILPEFRHGVCTGKDCKRRFHWLEHNGRGLFFCPDCLNPEETPDTGLYRIGSVSLLPLYLQTDLVPKQALQAEVEEWATRFAQTGYFSSSADTNRTVGYDYGLLLYNAVVLGVGDTDTMATRLLDLRDDTGAWTEYYVNGVAGNCPYRPWESAMNLEGLLAYAWSKA